MEKNKTSKVMGFFSTSILSCFIFKLINLVFWGGFFDSVVSMVSKGLFNTDSRVLC